MYKKGETKKIREQFWNQFKSWSGGRRIKKGKKGRWMMNDTGIRQVKLKFHFDEHIALAGIEIDTKNLEKRLQIWEKLESLKARLEDRAEFDLTWDLEYKLDDKKSVSRIYCQLSPVSIYNKANWKSVNDFLYNKMTVFEEFFLEYRDFIKYQ